MDDDTISRRMVLTILEGMAEQNDSAPRPESAEVFGLRKGIRMAIGTAMDRIKAMPGADETLHREAVSGVPVDAPTTTLTFHPFPQVQPPGGKELLLITSSKVFRKGDLYRGKQWRIEGDPGWNGKEYEYALKSLSDVIFWAELPDSVALESLLCDLVEALYRDDVNRLMATPDAEMDNELRRLGIDPAEAERQRQEGQGE